MLCIHLDLKLRCRLRRGGGLWFWEGAILVSTPADGFRSLVSPGSVIGALRVPAPRPSLSSRP